MSTPSFLGRSLMCPFEATTSNLEPRYFLIVLAFAGDSTTTRVFPISGFLFFALSCDFERLHAFASAEETRRAFYYYVLQSERQDLGGDGLDRLTRLS